MKPGPGQVWAFGGLNGRRDTIRRVIVGAVGSWNRVDGKLTRFGRSTAMWVQWESRMESITVAELLKSWVHVTDEPTCGRRYRAPLKDGGWSGTRHCSKPKSHKGKCGKADKQK